MYSVVLRIHMLYNNILSRSSTLHVYAFHSYFLHHDSLCHVYLSANRAHQDIFKAFDFTRKPFARESCPSLIWMHTTFSGLCSCRGAPIYICKSFNFHWKFLAFFLKNWQKYGFHERSSYLKIGVSQKLKNVQIVYNDFVLTIQRWRHEVVILWHSIAYIQLESFKAHDQAVLSTYNVRWWHDLALWTLNHNGGNIIFTWSSYDEKKCTHGIPARSP